MVGGVDELESCSKSTGVRSDTLLPLFLMLT